MKSVYIVKNHNTTISVMNIAGMYKIAMNSVMTPALFVQKLDAINSANELNEEYSNMSPRQFRKYAIDNDITDISITGIMFEEYSDYDDLLDEMQTLLNKKMINYTQFTHYLEKGAEYFDAILSW